MQVNTIKVPESDLMATNGVVHFVRTLLYPEGEDHSITQPYKSSTVIFCSKQTCMVCFFKDIPVGSQEFLSLLKRIIRYIQIKVLSYSVLLLNHVTHVWTTAAPSPEGSFWNCVLLVTLKIQFNYVKPDHPCAILLNVPKTVWRIFTKMDFPASG